MPLRRSARASAGGSIVHPSPAEPRTPNNADPPANAQKRKVQQPSSSDTEPILSLKKAGNIKVESNTVVEPPSTPKRAAAKRSKVKAEEADVEPEAPKPAPAKRQKVKAEEGEDTKPVPKPTSAKRKNAKVEAGPESFPPRTPTAGASSHYIGAHISSAGGVENAPLNALRIGSNAFSCFVRPKMQWASKPIPDTSIADFRARVAEHNYSDYAVPHGCYLVNLANPDVEKREKSYIAFLDDVQRCQALGVRLYNFHPGSTTGAITKEEGCKYVASYINRVLAETQGVTVLVENMAGRRGNLLGGDFKELRCILDHVQDKSRIGVCIDTCHAFAAGYDFRTRETYEAFVQQLDADIGLDYVKAMHLNDSKAGLDENKDRHENLGVGKLGLWPFYALVNDARFANIPLILETPGGDDDVMHSVWTREIAALVSPFPHSSFGQKLTFCPPKSTCYRGKRKTSPTGSRCTPCWRKCKLSAMRAKPKPRQKSWSRRRKQSTRPQKPSSRPTRRMMKVTTSNDHYLPTTTVTVSPSARFQWANVCLSVVAFVPILTLILLAAMLEDRISWCTYSRSVAMVDLSAASYGS